LPYDFPIEVEAFANKIDTSITEEEIKKRRDMRNVLTFTIDPKDAKDFDDALSFQQLRKWKL
jgi:exoribonuclease R